MSIYAKIENGIVVNTILCDDSQILSQSGTHIKITEETNNAGIGYEYVAEKNKFKAPQPYPSWILDEDTILWNPPVALPSGTTLNNSGILEGYRWDEENQEWIAL